MPSGMGLKGDPSSHLITCFGSKDQLDRISNKEWARSRRSSSSSSRMGDSSPNREIVQLASIKETVSAEKTTQADLESLITAKLTQCRVIFDFSCDPLSDLKYKVRYCGMNLMPSTLFSHPRLIGNNNNNTRTVAVAI